MNINRTLWALCRYRALFGALAIIIVGYLLLIINNLNGDSGSYSFINWLYYHPDSVFGWGILGGIFGSLWHVIATLERDLGR